MKLLQNWDFWVPVCLKTLKFRLLYSCVFKMRENSNFRRNLLPRRMFFAFRFINNNSLRDTRIPAECFCFSVSKENALVYPRTLANPLRFFHFEEKRFNRSEGGILFSIKTISLPWVRSKNISAGDSWVYRKRFSKRKTKHFYQEIAVNSRGYQLFYVQKFVTVIMSAIGFLDT